MFSHFHNMASSQCANLLMYIENAYSVVIQLLSLHRQFPQTVRLVLNCDFTLFHNSPELSVQISLSMKSRWGPHFTCDLHIWESIPPPLRLTSWQGLSSSTMTLWILLGCPALDQGKAEFMDNIQTLAAHGWRGMMTLVCCAPLEDGLKVYSQVHHQGYFRIWWD